GEPGKYGYCSALGDDQLDPRPRQFRGQLRNPLCDIATETALDRNVAPFDVSAIGQTGAQSSKKGHDPVRLLDGQPAETGHFFCALRKGAARLADDSEARSQQRASVHPRAL